MIGDLSVILGAKQARELDIALGGRARKGDVLGAARERAVLAEPGELADVRRDLVDAAGAREHGRDPMRGDLHVAMRAHQLE